MNRESGILLRRTLTRYRDRLDLMNIVALSPSVLNPEYFEDMRDAILGNNPDMIGVRVMNLNEEQVPEIKCFLGFLKFLSNSRTPIFIQC